MIQDDPDGGRYFLRGKDFLSPPTLLLITLSSSETTFVSLDMPTVGVDALQELSSPGIPHHLLRTN